MKACSQITGPAVVVGAGGRVGGAVGAPVVGPGRSSVTIKVIIVTFRDEILVFFSQLVLNLTRSIMF